MKTLTKDNIIERVRLILNEYQGNESGFLYDGDDDELDRLIAESTLNALEFVSANADASLLEGDAVITASIDEGGHRELAAKMEGVRKDSESSLHIKFSYVGDETDEDFPCVYVVAKVALPDFYRLVKASSSCWSMALSEAGNDLSEEYAKQKDKLTMGTPDRPAAFVIKEGSNYTLEMYSVKTEATIRIEYIKQPKTGEDGSVSISQNAEAGFLYYVAYLVLLTLQDAHAVNMLNQALPQLGMQTEGGA